MYLFVSDGNLGEEVAALSLQVDADAGYLVSERLQLQQIRRDLHL